VLGFALYPGLKADVADRRALGLSIHLMGRAPHEHHPSLARFRIDVVNLDDDLVLGAGQSMR
jgi:hypothetical protein